MDPSTVESHYGRSGLADRFLDALREAGRDPDNLTPDDLAPVDEFHLRGREATDELIELAGISADDRVLDVGSGVGGPARRIASTRGAHVTGADLTEEFCEVATMLAERTGLADKVEFRQADALELPFDDGNFDVVWTQHTAMNIADRPRLYGEMARVLRPGGRLVVYDICKGPGGDPHVPAPWASMPEASFLVTPDEMLGHLASAGFAVSESRDVTDIALEWLPKRLAAAAENPSPLGPQILLGEEAPLYFANVLRSLEEERIRVFEVLAER